MPADNLLPHHCSRCEGQINATLAPCPVGVGFVCIHACESTCMGCSQGSPGAEGGHAIRGRGNGQGPIVIHGCICSGVGPLEILQVLCADWVHGLALQIGTRQVHEGACVLCKITSGLTSHSCNLTTAEAVLLQDVQGRQLNSALLEYSTARGSYQQG